MDPGIQEPVYEIDRVMNDGMKEGRREYLVRWKSYNPTEDTWEPSEHFKSKKPIQLYQVSKRKLALDRTHDLMAQADA